MCLIVLYDDLGKKIKGTRKFSNNEAGFKSLLEWVEKKRDTGVPVDFTLEPTGVYHENLSYFLK